MADRNFKGLIVWEKSMDLAVEIHELVKFLPKDELYGISNQLRRAAVSIPSNIAEGYTRSSTPDYTKFLSYARGSNAEVETQLLICFRVGYLTEEQIEKALSLCNEIVKMLTRMILNNKK